MKISWTIPALLLLASPGLGAVPKMESTYYVISSSEFSAMGKYKISANPSSAIDTWDTFGQPTAIGAWLAANQSSAISLGGNNSGAGWIYTISLPIFYDKDRDHDGMPQAFEEQFDDQAWSADSGLDDFNPADAAVDGDGDGFLNIQEYLARSDPTDPSSFFQFTDIRILTNDGYPTLVWQNPTIKIDGMESEYPNYPRSLGYDILYADWSRSSQLQGQFPSVNWFNLTGTWQLHPNGINRPRDPVDSEENIIFKDTTATSLGNRDIRFYRLAIAGTWDQGEPVVTDSEATWRYYTEVGEYFLASTLAREVMMVQRHNIPAGETHIWMGAPGNPAGGDGKFDLFLGTDFFTYGPTAPQATVFSYWAPEWNGQTGRYIRDYLGFVGYDHAWVDEYTSEPSGRTVPGEDGFFLTASQYGSFPALSFYAGATLKTDSYYHDVYRRHDAGPWLPAYNPDVSYYWRATLINYNYPVSLPFPDAGFPAFAGTTSPSIPGWQGFESDWVVFYNQDLSAKGGSSNTPVVIIYYDHVVNNAWTYQAPLGGTIVGAELKFNPGSPVALIQYWNPDSPTAWSAHTVGFGLPYQKEAAEIKSYLQMVDD